MTSEQKKWIDPQGRTVPDHLVTDQERMKDELAERLVSSAEAVQKVMLEFKKTAMDEMYAARDLILDRYGAKVGGKKGGFSFRTFGGSAEVGISVQDRIMFGPELQAAKALIDECIEGWGEGANDNLRLLVDDAFQVNKAGRIDTKRVLSLRKHRMKNEDGTPDERWARAMDAISDALIVDMTATYIRFYRRDSRTNGMVNVDLNFSSL